MFRDVNDIVRNSRSSLQFPLCGNSRMFRSYFLIKIVMFRFGTSDRYRFPRQNLNRVRCPLMGVGNGRIQVQMMVFRSGHHWGVNRERTLRCIQDRVETVLIGNVIDGSDAEFWVDVRKRTWNYQIFYCILDRWGCERLFYLWRCRNHRWFRCASCRCGLGIDRLRNRRRRASGEVVEWLGVHRGAGGGGGRLVRCDWRHMLQTEVERLLLRAVNENIRVKMCFLVEKLSYFPNLPPKLSYHYLFLS